jgi:hypothetical protein
MKLTSIGIRIDTNTKEELKKYAYRNDLSLSEYVENILIEHCKHIQTMTKQLQK